MMDLRVCCPSAEGPARPRFRWSRWSISVALGAIAFAAAGCATSDGIARDDAVPVGVGGTSGGGTGTSGSAGLVPGGASGIDGTATGTVAGAGGGGSEPSATVSPGGGLGGAPAPAGVEPGASGSAAGSATAPDSDGGATGIDVGPADGGGGGQSGNDVMPVVDAGGEAGGGAGGANSPGSDAGLSESVYNPCPNDGSPCVILPLGDSITYGDKSSDTAGYRSHLYRLILASNQKVTFTGSRSEGPTQVSGQPFPRMHEGHPGWTIDPGYNTNPAFDGGISQLIPSPALDGNPHIILLCIGTNDLFARDTANMAARLEILLDDIVANAPNSLIVLAQITPLRDANAALTAYNESIPGIVQDRALMGQHIVGVDMSTLPDSGLHSDGTHPNDEGYAYMAGVWYEAIEDLLPQ